jgi:hypothetical protein
VRLLLLGVSEGHCLGGRLPANLQYLRNLITAAAAQVDRDMLTRVWNEMDYRKNVSRITKGGHIEHL